MNEIINLLTPPTPYANNRKFGDSPYYLIIHGIGTSLEFAKEILSGQSEYKVSAHYFIQSTGEILYYVDEIKRAWHAGKSYWNNDLDINNRSIGIELQTSLPLKNATTSFDDALYTDAQMQSLASLSQSIIQKYKIKPYHVLAHQDIAPYRKYDPGRHFDWSFMAKNHIGAWHDLAPISDDKEIKDAKILEKFKSDLCDYGYDPRIDGSGKGFSWVIKAFQTHFLPWYVTGKVNRQTLQALEILCDKRTNYRQLEQVTS